MEVRKGEYVQSTLVNTNNNKNPIRCCMMVSIDTVHFIIIYKRNDIFLRLLYLWVLFLIYEHDFHKNFLFTKKYEKKKFDAFLFLFK